MQRKNLAIVDTNVLIYDLLENSEFHEISRKLLDNLDRMLILPNIIVEFILVSKRLKIPKDTIISKVKEILDNSIIIHILKSDITTAITLNINEINDSLLVAVAKRLNLSVISFDKDVEKLGEKLGEKVIHG
ncbi:PIN domain-containing protein [Acidianus sp. HS-5]|uniref:PIN domain-containing protein n=1 Tax=Acidianus sp. HS-5 TaxID=2886040 RepID=UPI001F471484|nr:PIN domain-containing protein [Acidianus sp. HS-5]